MDRHWKCLVKGMKSREGKGAERDWEVGVWREVPPPLVWCGEGLHCSPTPLDAMNWVTPAYIAEVEVDGESVVEPTKSCHQRMRLIRVWKWTVEDSVGLALFCARDCQHLSSDCRVKATNDLTEKWLLDHESVTVKELQDAVAAVVAATRAAWRAATRDTEAAEAAKERYNAWIVERLDVRPILKGA